MIPRTLVPRDARPLSEQSGTARARRLGTELDARTLLAAVPAAGPLEERSQIPAHLPLEVFARRQLVPRDMPVVPLEIEATAPEDIAASRLDDRIVVPPGSRAPEAAAPAALERLPELLEPDVLTTGEVNLLVEVTPPSRAKFSRMQATLSSVAFHALVVVLILLQPKLFPYHEPTPQEVEMAHRSLGLIYLPPEVREVPRIPAPPAEQLSPKIRIDPRILRQPGPPPEDLITPGPTGREGGRALPEPPLRPEREMAEESRRTEAARPQLKLENPKEPAAPPGLIVPRSSPGRLLEDSLRAAIEDRGGASSDFGGPIPPRPSPGGSGTGSVPGSGGGGQGYLGGNVQILTPTEGVDFTNYMARVLASVRRNWYAVIPESARLGERGKVVIQFRILSTGNVPSGEPYLVATSGREPLDRAAMSSIRASSPFEPLPSAFRGPFIELRFIFLYNLPLDTP
jgi:outer membrane biosynthesis protein TonB